MKQISERIYQANEGCFIVRKVDDFIMGESIDLGSADSIDNYEDRPFTEESYKEFYESIGVDINDKNKPSRERNRKNEKIPVEEPVEVLVEDSGSEEETA